MTTNASTVYVKRLQSRASRLGVKRNMEQCRKVYAACIVNPAYPTDEEMETALTQLTTIEQPSEEVPGDLAIPEPQTIEITPDENPDVWETVQPEEPEPEQSALTTTQPSELSAPAPAVVTQSEIQQAVEQQFGEASAQTRAAIVDYVAKDVFETAQDLQSALAQLRQMKLDILMKLVMDYDQQSAEDDQMVQTALQSSDQKQQRRRQDFFNQLQGRISQGRAAFNL